MRARSNSLILDIYGAYVRSLGGWIAIADLITLMGDLGVESQTVRSSVSRLTRRGLLVRRRRGELVGYELGDEAKLILREGDHRIFASVRPADIADGWVLAMFSVPEEERERRHELRSQLTGLGFGSLGGGAWIAPLRVKPSAQEALTARDLEGYVDLFEAHYQGFGELEELVARCWDLDKLNARYTGFVDAARPVLARWKQRRGGHEGRDAFVDYTTLLHRWRKMPYLDPGLPDRLLPREWQGRVAADLFREAVERLEKRARRYVESVVRVPG